jgi:hypothetical protein
MKPARSEVQTRLRKMQRHGAGARAQLTSQIVNRNQQSLQERQSMRFGWGSMTLTERGSIARSCDHRRIERL